MLYVMQFVGPTRPALSASVSYPSVPVHSCAVSCICSAAGMACFRIRCCHARSIVKPGEKDFIQKNIVGAITQRPKPSQGQILGELPGSHENGQVPRYLQARKMELAKLHAAKQVQLAYIIQAANQNLAGASVSASRSEDNGPILSFGDRVHRLLALGRHAYGCACLSLDLPGGLRWTASCEIRFIAICFGAIHSSDT